MIPLRIEGKCSEPLLLEDFSEEVKGCWQRTKESVVWFCNIVVRTGSWAFHATTALFFSCLRYVWPSGADRVEALWLHFTSIIERISFAIREEGLLGEIDRLRKENLVLRGQVQIVIGKAETFRVRQDHTTWDLGITKEERDRAREERDQKVSGKAELVRTCEELQQENQQLQQNLKEVDEERSTNVGETGHLRTQLSLATQEVEVMKLQLARQDAIAKLLEQCGRENELEDPGPEGMHQLEYAKLLPLWAAQRESIETMVLRCLEPVPEDAPLRVPLNAILRILKEESGHLARISKELKFNDALKQLLAQT